MFKTTLKAIRQAKVAMPKGVRVVTASALGELISMSPPNSVARKGRCQVAFVGFSKKDSWHVTYKVTCSEHDSKGKLISDPRGHIVKMRFYPEVGIEDPMDLEVEVSCSCKAFQYWGAAWHAHGENALLQGQYSSYKGPILAPTEPRHNFVVCKHVAAVSTRVSTLLTKHLTDYNQDEV